jgi:hypothetical protein
VNLMIRGRLLETLKPGTRIVSHDYGMGDWAPDYSTELDAPGKTVGISPRSKILYWVVPGRAAGRWRWKMTLDGKPVELELALQQNFQVLEGTLAAGGRAGRVEKGRLDGDKVEIKATADGRQYGLNGRMIRNALEGTVRVTRNGATVEQPWSATRVELWDPRHAALTRDQALKELH